MPEAVPLGKGEIEGDMNAGTQAILIRYTLHELGAAGTKAGYCGFCVLISTSRYG